MMNDAFFMPTIGTDFQVKKNKKTKMKMAMEIQEIRTVWILLAKLIKWLQQNRKQLQMQVDRFGRRSTMEQQVETAQGAR